MAALAHVVLHLDQKFTEDVVDAGRIRLVLVGLIFFFTFLPIVLDTFEISYFVLCQLLKLLIVFGSIGEEFSQELL